MNDMAEDYMDDLEEQVGFFGIESLTETSRLFI